MNIEHRRTADSEATPEELVDRLDQWARRTGFRLVVAGPPRWLYERGHWWHKLYSFDIRKWPTQVLVERRNEPPGQITCSICCRCWLTLATPNDSDKLLDDLELLVAYTCARAKP